MKSFEEDANEDDELRQLNKETGFKSSGQSNTISETEVEDHLMKIANKEGKEDDINCDNENEHLPMNNSNNSNKGNNEYLYYSTVFTIVIIILTSLVYFVYTKVHISVLVTEIQIIKPAISHKDYRIIKLINGMEVLLISDPLILNCGASLTVTTGSTNEKEIKGLAHLTEHTIYLGSKTFPEPNHFLKFISSYLGELNAFTQDESTTFYFHVGHNSFHQALLMFAKMFSEPLFEIDAIRKEADIINSEYLSNINKMSWIEEHIIKNFASANHSYSSFTIGNKEIFDKYETSILQKKIIEFHAKYYIGQNMKLVVSSNQSLDNIQSIIVNYFSEIKGINTNIYKEKNREKEIEAFPIENKRKIVYFDKEGNDPIIDFVFFFDSIKPYISTKPEHYIDYILNSKKKGSLYHYLSSKDLISNMEAGISKSLHSFALYTISITPSRTEGIVLEELISTVFSYLNYFQTVSVNETLFKEIASIDKIFFNFKQDSQDLGISLSELSLAMRDEYNLLSHILIRDYYHEKYDSEIISKYINMLTINNSLVLISGGDMMNNQYIKEKLFNNSISNTDQWYHRNYTYQSLDVQIINFTEMNSNSSLFTFNEPNAFIANITEPIIAISKDKLIQEAPILFLTKPNMKLWYQSDLSYSMPSIITNIQIVSPTLLQKNSNYLFIFHLWFNYLRKNQLTDLDDFILAKGEISFDINQNGINIHILSYSDITSRVLKTLITSINKSKVMDSYTYDQYVNITMNTLEFGMNNNLYQKSRDIFLKIIKPHHFIQKELINFNMSYEDFYIHFIEMTNSLAFKVLCYGNINEETIMNISFQFTTLASHTADSTFTSALNSNETEIDKDDIMTTFTKLNEQNNISSIITYQSNDIFENEEEGISDNYFKYSSKNDLFYPYSILLESLWGTMFFQYLRTEKQLGYVVFSLKEIIDNIVYLRFLVQGNKFSPNEINIELDKVIWKLKEKIEMLNIDQFNQLKTNIMQLLKKREISLNEQADKIWKEIVNESYVFNRKKKLSEGMDKVTLNGLIAEFDRVFITQPEKISVQLYSKSHSLTNNTEEVYYLNIEKKSRVTSDLNILNK